MSELKNTVNSKKYRPSSQQLMDQVRKVLRYHHYGLQAEEAYLRWIKQFIHGHPKDMGKTEIEKFLTDLAVDKNVAASTQNQALNALIFIQISVGFACL
jgi:integrase-like protein